MPAEATIPRSVLAAVVVFSCLFALRYVAVIDGGVSHALAIRTYVFWAVVTLPVALLVEVLGRTIMNYRVVKLAVARVRSDDHLRR